MSLIELKGNIFCTKAQTIVNTVNCVGVMGAGIALECKLRYPEMFQKYADFCEAGLFEPGKLWLYKQESPWVLNFPTKKHWRYPSKESYLQAGLEKFVQTYEEKGITSIAFPLLGADKGGIPKDISLSIMKEYLSNLPIDIEIYEYDPKVADPFYTDIQDWITTTDLQALSQNSGIRLKYLEVIKESMGQGEVHQISQILNIKGIGLTTLEKLLDYRNTQMDSSTTSLF